ncbi:RNase PH family protein [Abortiporus biennis]
MSSRVEILNDGGYRSDGRKQYELRDITIDLTPRGSADGSATITHGLTEVLVEVFGPREAKVRSQTMHDRALINVEVSLLPFSASERRKRSRGDKRVLELAAAIKSTFEPVVQTSIYPRSEIDIFVHVLQQDGGLLQAGINATTLALITAGIPMIDFVCAVTGGVYSTSPLLDLTTLEENDTPNVTVAIMPRTKKVTLVSMETRLHVDRFGDVFKLACEAGAVLHQEMKVAVESRTRKLVGAMETGPSIAIPGAERGDRDVYMEDNMNDDF